MGFHIIEVSGDEQLSYGCIILNLDNQTFVSTKKKPLEESRPRPNLMVPLN